LLRGLKRVYFDLPRAARSCSPLMAAAEIDAPAVPAERTSW